MKLIIDGYEVEIKAKHTFEQKNNKGAVMGFLNHLSILFHEAGEYNTEHYGYDCGYQKESDDLYQFLKARGCYDDLD